MIQFVFRSLVGFHIEVKSDLEEASIRVTFVGEEVIMRFLTLFKHVVNHIYG